MLLRWPLAPALISACSSRGLRGLLLAFRHRWAGVVLTVPITVVIAILVSVLIAVAIPIWKPAMVPPVGPIITVTIIAVGVVAAMLTLGLVGRGLMHQGRLETIIQHIIPILVAEFVAGVAFRAYALAVAIGGVAGLLQLLAIGHDDARVVLGVLQIVLRQHRIPDV